MAYVCELDITPDLSDEEQTQVRETLESHSFQQTLSFIQFDYQRIHVQVESNDPDDEILATIADLVEKSIDEDTELVGKRFVI